MLEIIRLSNILTFKKNYNNKKIIKFCINNNNKKSVKK